MLHLALCDFDTIILRHQAILTAKLYAGDKPEAMRQAEAQALDAEPSRPLPSRNDPYDDDPLRDGTCLHTVTLECNQVPVYPTLIRRHVEIPLAPQ